MKASGEAVFSLGLQVRVSRIDGLDLQLLPRPARADRLWDSGGRVMLVRGPLGVGKTTVPQAGRNAFRMGTAGPKALTNLVPSGRKMYHPLGPGAWLACRERGRPCAEHNLMPGK
jgi:hypothetical protein